MLEKNGLQYVSATELKETKLRNRIVPLTCFEKRKHFADECVGIKLFQLLRADRRPVSVNQKAKDADGDDQ